MPEIQISGSIYWLSQYVITILFTLIDLVLNFLKLYESTFSLRLGEKNYEKNLAFNMQPDEEISG